MAIQNFLSGGFYGKVGDVIGQRWHNKRYIRSYFIPFNPRTEKQQSNRELFTLATKLAQEAYNINKGSPLWDTTSKSQFSLMVGTAKMRLQAGKSPAEALPLYPDGYSPNIILSAPSVNWSTWGREVTISDSSYRFPDSRMMAIQVYCKNELTGNPGFFSDTITIPAGSFFSYTFLSDNKYSLPAGSNIQVTSTDDSQHGGGSIRLPPFSLSQPRVPYLDIYLTGLSFEYSPGDDSIFVYYDTGGFLPWFTCDVEIYCFDTYENKWVFEPDTIDSHEDGTASITIQCGNDLIFPQGSFIQSNDENLITSTADITFHWEDFIFKYP